LPQPGKPLVGPWPLNIIEAARRRSFPQDRITERANAQLGDPVEIFNANRMTAALYLIKIVIADAVDRAFNSGP
jgi:hypothetical protein